MAVASLAETALTRAVKWFQLLGKLGIVLYTLTSFLKVGMAASAGWCELLLAQETP